MFFFDLDLFKEINDRYGHTEGDRILTSFGSVLRDTFRESDAIGRLGGDEFAVLLTNADETAGKEVLNRLRQAVQSVDDLLQEADALMYEQKNVQNEKPSRPIISNGRTNWTIYACDFQTLRYHVRLLDMALSFQRGHSLVN